MLRGPRWTRAPQVEELAHQELLEAASVPQEPRVVAEHQEQQAVEVEHQEQRAVEVEHQEP